MKRREKNDKKNRQKTAAGNLEHVYSEYPEIKELINIKFGSDYLPDPFEKDPNQASRKVSKKTNM